MSAPNTNEENKDPAHKTPIYGMIAVVIFALVLLFALITWLTYDGNNPQEDNPVQDGIYKGVPETEQAPQAETGTQSAPEIQNAPQSQTD